MVLNFFEKIKKLNDSFKLFVNKFIYGLKNVVKHFGWWAIAGSPLAITA